MPDKILGKHIKQKSKKSKEQFILGGSPPEEELKVQFGTDLNVRRYLTCLQLRKPQSDENIALRTVLSYQTLSSLIPRVK